MCRVRMMRVDKKRIVRMVTLESWECQSKVKWVEDLKASLEKFGWSSGVVEKLEGVSVDEVKRMAEVTAGFEERGEKERVTLVLDEGCRNLKAGKAIAFEYM